MMTGLSAAPYWPMAAKLIDLHPHDLADQAALPWKRGEAFMAGEITEPDGDLARFVEVLSTKHRVTIQARLGLIADAFGWKLCE